MTRVGAGEKVSSSVVIRGRRNRAISGPRIKAEQIDACSNLASPIEASTIEAGTIGPD